MTSNKVYLPFASVKFANFADMLTIVEIRVDIFTSSVKI